MPALSGLEANRPHATLARTPCAFESGRETPRATRTAPTSWQLESIQGAMNDLASQCEQLWARYESLEGDKHCAVTPEADGGFLGIGGHDADSPEAKKEAEDNQSFEFRSGSDSVVVNAAQMLTPVYDATAQALYQLVDTMEVFAPEETRFISCSTIDSTESHDEWQEI